MMKLEEKLKEMDLSQFKVDGMTQMAIEICRWRLFKTNVAMKNFECWKTLFTRESTAVWYFNQGCRYLKTGTTKDLPKSFVERLDKYKNITKPVVPTNPQDARLEMTRITRRKRRKNTELVKKEHVKQEKAPKSLITKFYYALRYKNFIVTFDTAKEVSAFLSGFSYGQYLTEVREENFERIHLNYEDIEAVSKE